MKKDIKKRIKELRKEINLHNKRYYVNNRPEVSDQEYDRLITELRKLEEANPELVTLDSPTQKVGGEVLKEFKTVEHRVPMLSIDNTYSPEELREFNERVKKNLEI
ncbi:MAG: NAD-dependent DNA ligase LigA, partial [Candidatus Omnitrophota bacterium]|nr:NAD-dependent DNA ligase LigA [Candidatus Omnitrophota bacterium]